MESGELDREKYRALGDKVLAQYPDMKMIAITHTAVLMVRRTRSANS